MILKGGGGGGEKRLFPFFENYVECRGKDGKKAPKETEDTTSVPYVGSGGGRLGIHYIPVINNIQTRISKETRHEARIMVNPILCT